MQPVPAPAAPAPKTEPVPPTPAPVAEPSLAPSAAEAAPAPAPATIAEPAVAPHTAPAPEVSRVVTSDTTQETVSADAADSTWLTASLGYAVWQRLGKVPSTVDKGTVVSCYCSADGSAGPMVGGGVVRATAWPGVFLGKSGHLRRLGVQLSASATELETVVDMTTGQVEANTVVSLRGAVTYRLPLLIAGFRLITSGQFGYGTYKFPLRAGAFPGVQYAGPLLGASIEYRPLDFLIARVAGEALYPLSAAGGTALMGDKQASGAGMGYEATVVVELSRWVQLPVFVEVGLRGDQYLTSYKGQSTLRAGQQVDDGSIEDISSGGWVGLGVSL